MVAKSYQSLKQIGEPFTESGRKYIYVEKNGEQKKVRWYNETEYAKLYPDDEPAVTRIRTVKEVLGFEKGYITIFKGDTYSLIDWFRESEATYHKLWGWNFWSTMEIPKLPAGVEPIKLYWENIADVEKDELKSEAEIKKVVESLIYEPSNSEYQGEVGERITRLLTVKKVFKKEGYYGNSALHIFSDEAGNVYTWNTSSKTLEVGRTYHLKGTVKEHTCFRNVNQTNLTRCAICQDKSV